MKKKWIIVGVIALISSASIVFWGTRKSYESISPKKGSITEAIYGLGTVKSRRVYEVKLGVMSSINRIFFQEGDPVKKGDLLATFMDGPRFQAPFTGTVTAVNFHDGENVLPQATVLRMEDLENLYIEVSLEQEGALRTAPGQSVKVLFESIRGEVLMGKVSALFPRNGEFIAQIDVEKLSEKVLPGMTADVTIEVGKIENATLIPISAIHNGMVIVRRDGKKEKIKVEVGHVDSLWAEVPQDVVHLNDEVLIPTKGWH